MAGRFSDSAWHRKPATSRRSVRVLLLVLGLAIAGLIAGPLASAIQSGLSPTTSPTRVTESGLTSWTPHLSCSADLVTIRDVLGPAYPTHTVNGSRYQTNSTAGGIPQERALSPPCTITNKTGTVLSPFVQINGVSLYGYGIKTTDCSGWYSKQNGGGRYPNNQTFCTNAGQIITIGTTRGYLRIEIDRDWLGKGYCGVGVPYCNNATLGQYQSNGSISLDFQGFVFWEGPYHWELHPLTGWRLSAPPTPPSAPTNLVATAGNAQVGLTWQAPASNGGSPITNYRIYRGTSSNGETLLATIGNVLTYTDTAVTNGVTYYYQVSAVNGAGEGPRSNEASATPSPPPPPNAPPTVDFTWTPTSGDTTTVFTFTATASDDHDPPNTIQIRWDWTGDGTWDTTWSATKTASHTFSSPGTYTVVVQAKDSGGLTATQSHTIIVTAPPPPGDFSISASPASLHIVCGSSGSSGITLTSLNGLSGTASLSASISSSGLVLFWPTVSVSPTSVTLPSAGTATSTLTVSTSALTTPGTYTVTVTATIGSITHSVDVTVLVTLT